MRASIVTVGLLVMALVGRDAAATPPPEDERSPGPQPHPQLTPLGYQLSAQKEHALATRRYAVKQQRLRDLATRQRDAQARGDVGLAQLLAAVIERIEAGPPNAPTANAWGSEHVAHMRAVDQWRKYGAQLDQPDVVDEFEKHAIRIAKLRRMREVVQTKTPSPEREARLMDIETTTEMEATRHVERLERWLKPIEGKMP